MHIVGRATESVTCGPSAGWWARAGRAAWSALVDMLYPPVCVGCGARHEPGQDVPLCKTCRKALPVIGESACPRCGMALGPYTTGRAACPARHEGLVFLSAVAACSYRGVAADVVCALKFGRDMRALEVMAPLMARRAQRAGLASQAAVVVPVPLHWRRRAWRRFNQAELLGERVAEALDLPIEPAALQRVRYTIPQVRLAARERRSNLRGAFRVRDRGAVRGARVLLVDDVMTTCATARECAHVLREAGAVSVRVAVFARSSSLMVPTGDAGQDAQGENR